MREVSIEHGRRVWIQWADIQSHGDWNDEPEALITADSECGGWTFGEWTKHQARVTLASHRSVEEDTHHDKTSFPTGCIVSVQDAYTWEELWDVPKREDE